LSDFSRSTAERAPAMPLAGLAVIGYVLYEMASAAKIMGAVWIALGLVYFAVHSIILKKPAAIDL
jgi:hypothetical protein